MQLKNKAFPYPILDQTDRSRDDYLNESFAGTISVGELQDDFVKITVDYDCSVSELGDLVDQGKAQYCLLITSPDTFVRRTYLTQKRHQEIQIVASDLYDRVVFTPQLVATREVQGFYSANQNPEYGSQSFKLMPGDVLALGASETRYFQFDNLGIKDIFQVYTSNELLPLEYSINTQGHFLQITMGSSLRKLWDEIRSERELQPLVGMSIYKDCLMVAINDYVKDKDKVIEKTWGRVLEKSLLAIGAPENDDIDAVNRVAQKLLEEFPMRLCREREIKHDL